MTVTLAVETRYKSLEAKARALAEKLQLPFTQEENPTFDYLLTLTPEYLGLKKLRDRSHPLYIDFQKGKLHYRKTKAHFKNEMLVRAFGLKKSELPVKILDATAGLARDSFVLASLGFHVHMLERSPILCALIQDGLDRAEEEPFRKHLTLENIDAIDWFNRLSPAEYPPYVYLDPMFPHRKKSALVQKDMRFLQDLLGKDLASDQLLEKALACATQRVVVKRPRFSEPLASSKPSFSLFGKSNRFDVYLK